MGTREDSKGIEHRMEEGRKELRGNHSRCKGFPFPKHKCSPLCLHFSSLPFLRSLSLPPCQWFLSLPPPIPLTLYLPFPLYVVRPFNGPRPGTLGAQEIRWEVFVCVYGYVCVCVYLCVCVCVCVYLSTHTDIYTNTYIYLYLYI